LVPSHPRTKGKQERGIVFVKGGGDGEQVAIKKVKICSKRFYRV